MEELKEQINLLRRIVEFQSEAIREQHEQIEILYEMIKEKPVIFSN